MGSLIDVRADIGFRDRTVVEDFRASIEPGESVLLVGVNGVGKTTTLRTLAGLLPPRRGEVSVLGRQAQDPDLLGQVAYVPDSPGLYPELTGYDHVDMLTALWSGRRDVVDWATLQRWTGLASFADQQARYMSRGQQQRLFLALSVMVQPTVLLLDEPFNSLDFYAVEGLRELIQDVTSAGGCVIVTSHLAEVAAPTTDRVLVLRDGALVADERVAADHLPAFLKEWHGVDIEN